MMLAELITCRHQTHAWRAVEKSESSVTPSEFYRVVQFTFILFN